MWQFLFQHGFSFHGSTTDFFTSVNDRVFRASNISGPTQAAVLGISYPADTKTSQRHRENILTWYQHVLD